MLAAAVSGDFGVTKPEEQFVARGLTTIAVANASAGDRNSIWRLFGGHRAERQFLRLAPDAVPYGPALLARRLHHEMQSGTARIWNFPPRRLRHGIGDSNRCEPARHELLLGFRYPEIPGNGGGEHQLLCYAPFPRGSQG